ncbi:MAG: YHS domain protein [Chitinophagales bacterium]|nr:YHS domain protein [Chitinophagales bacterium]
MKTIKIIAKVFGLVLLCNLSFAQEALRSKQFNLESGIAIQGYDPVAYFSENKAVKGNKQFSAVVGGVTYLFASSSNLDLFLKNYIKYEPQYGGWCAYAMGANGEKVAIDPETFKIANGRLYLFYHSWTNNTLIKWNDNENTLRIKADNNWQTIYQ